MASHTSTGEWKSFEIRMRRRRAEHLVVRAEAAADAGCFDEAREALHEARRLASDLPRLISAEQSIEALQTAAELKRQPRLREASLYAAVVVLLIVGIAGATWIARHTPDEAAAQNGAPAAPEAPLPAPAPGPRPVVIEHQPITVTETSLPTARVEPTDVEAARLPLPISEPPPTAAAVPAIVPHPDDKPAERDETSVPALTAIPAGDIATPPSSVSISPVAAVPVDARPTAANAIVNSTAPADNVLVQRALQRYATAYSRLDAYAAQQVWPSVNRQALARAFGDLSSQQVSLGNCQIDVHGEAAHAACAGTATWAPKVGAREPKTEARNWNFELMKAGTAWQIVSARVQNK